MGGCGGGMSMIVADGLVPIWHQGICNDHDDVGRVIHIPTLQIRTQCGPGWLSPD